MGFFSWITSDTKRSIPNRYCGAKQFRVHMVTRDGDNYVEDNYEGYGVFGGKDYYELLAEINGKTDRDDGISLFFGIDYITDGNKKYYSQGRDFRSWMHDIIEGEGKSANDLLDSGWECKKEYDPKIKMVKLVEFDLMESDPSKVHSLTDWQKWFDGLPNSEDCPDQGHFYEGIEL